MKYLLLFLLVSTTAYCASSDELAIRAIHEKWTFEYDASAPTRTTGFVPNPKLRSHAQYAGVTAVTNLPAHFDLTPTLSPVKDQGMCGGCWAFGTAAVVENFPFGPKPIKPVILSEQNILDCDTVSQGCEGGDFDGFDYAKNTGVAAAKDYPFAGATQSCNQVAPLAKVLTWAFVSGNANTEPTVDQIKTALYTYKAPIAVAIYATDALQAYTSGVFNACETGQPNHMVDIVGWDDVDADWIVRNSWGDSFGEKGYFRIKRLDSNGAKCLSIGVESAFVSNASIVGQP